MPHHACEHLGPKVEIISSTSAVCHGLPEEAGLGVAQYSGLLL